MQKTILLILFLCWLFSASGQWLQTAPVTGSVLDIFEKDNKLFCTGLGGLFESNDQGVNWKKVYHAGSPQLDAAYLYNIQVNNGKVYFSASNSFYRSDNNGKNWSTSTFPNGTILSLAIDLDEILAFVSTPTGVKLMLSKDAGVNWQNQSGNVPISYLTPTYTPRISFLNGTYFIHQQGEDSYRSVDKGQVWVKNNLVEKINKIVVDEGRVFALTGGKYYESKDLGVSWIEHILLGETPDWISVRDSLAFLTTMGKTIYRSVQSGDSWEKLPLDYSLLGSPAVYSNKICIGKKGIIYAPSTFGLSYSKDLGLTWRQCISEGFTPNGCWSVDTLGENIMGYFRHRIATGVTACISTDFGESWVGSYPLDDGYSNLKQIKGSVYCINYGKLKRSPNYGRNWFDITIDSVQSCALFEGDSNNLFLYTNRGLLRSNNSASSWKTCNLVGLPNVPLHELRFDGENLLIILSNQLYISKDLGDSWSKVEFGLVNFNYVDHLFVLGKLIIATKADDIVSSNDSGLTWRSIKNSLGYNFLQPQVLLHQGKLLICGVGLPVQLSNEDFTT